MLDQVHSDRSRAEQDRRCNALTSELDTAILYLNRAKDCKIHGALKSADHWRMAAAVALDHIGPELLIIDSDAIL